MIWFPDYETNVKIVIQILPNSSYLVAFDKKACPTTDAIVDANKIILISLHYNCLSVQNKDSFNRQYTDRYKL